MILTHILNILFVLSIAMCGGHLCLSLHLFHLKTLSDKI